MKTRRGARAVLLFFFLFSLFVKGAAPKPLDEDHASFDARLEPLGALLAAWPPHQLEPPPAFASSSSSASSSASAAVPLLDGASAAGLRAAERLQRLQRPFVLRGAPGLARAARLWTGDYLRARAGEGARAPRLHLFRSGNGVGGGNGDNSGGGGSGVSKFANGFFTNALGPMRDAAAWWARWEADVGVGDVEALVSQDAERAAVTAAAGGSGGKSGDWRTYLQMSSHDAGGVHSFLEDDLGVFTLWRLPPCADGEDDGFVARGGEAGDAGGGDGASSIGGGLRCRPRWARVLAGDPAVAAATPVECRFGLRGTAVEAHFDTYDNFVALLTGRRRFVLAPPAACVHLNVSRAPARLRHSLADWSSAATWASAGFAAARATQVVLEAGDVLYVPPFWFHYIISLTHTAQCSKMVAKNVFALDALTCLAEAARAEAVLGVTAAGAPASADAAVEAAAGALARLLVAGLGAEGGGAVEAAAGGNDESPAMQEARAARARDVEAVLHAITPAPPAGSASTGGVLPPWARADLAPFSSVAESVGGLRRLAERGAQLLRELAATVLGAALPCAPLPAAEAWAPNVTAALLRRTAAALGALDEGGGRGDGDLAARLHFSPQQARGGAGAPGGGEPAFVVTASLRRAPPLRLRLHFHDVPSLHSDDAPVIAGSPSGLAGGGAGRAAPGGGSGAQWAALTDISAAREVAVYDFALRREGGGLLRTTTVFCLPSFRGALGLARSVRANLRDALQEGVFSRAAAFGVLLLVAGPLCVPLLGAYWLCARRRGRGGAGRVRTAREKAENKFE